MKKSRRKTLLLFLISGICLGLLLLFIFKNSLANWYVERQLLKIENLAYGDLQVKLQEGEVLLYDLSYHSPLENISINADKVHLKGIKLYKLFTKNLIDLDSLQLNRLQISYLDRKTDKPKKELNPWKLKIAYFELKEAQADLIMDGTNSSVSQLNLWVKELAVEPFNKESFFKYGDFELQVATAELNNVATQMELNQLYVDSKKSLKIAEVEVKTIKKTLRRTSNLTAYFKNISSNYDVDSLIQKQRFYSNSVNLDSFYIYSNVQRYKDSTTADLPKMINQMIEKSPGIQYIKELTFQNGFIEYEGYNEMEDKHVALDFKKIKGNVVNLGQGSQEHPFAKVNFSFDFAEVLHIQGNISYDLISKNEAHRITGKINPFETTVLNPLMKIIAPLEFKSGSVHYFYFDMDLNQDKAQSKVDLRYEDLKLSNLKNEKGETLKGAAIFLANKLVVRTNNPRGDKLILGNANCKRDEEMSIFYYWWRALYSGFEDVIVHKKSL